MLEVSVIVFTGKRSSLLGKFLQRDKIHYSGNTDETLKKKH